MSHSTKSGRGTPPTPRFYSLELPLWASPSTATGGASSETRPLRRRLRRTKRQTVGKQ
jgi:hypothetical protein